MKNIQCYLTMERIDAIYARQSADRSDSISIESQIEFCTYETRGAPFRVFSDRGFSGKNTDRPEFRQMLEEVRAGRIRRVICYKLDRCSRSILDFTTLMEFFRIHDVQFISCTEKFDTSTPMGRAMLSICIVFAQLERETIQQRVYDAYHARCKYGFYMGGRIPFGYRLQPCCISGKKTNCYTKEPFEASVVCKLYELYAHPNASLAEVCRDLSVLGIRNPRREDGLWIRSHIGRMLRNPIYVRADLAVYHYFKEQKIQIQNSPEDFIGIHGCYLFTDRNSGSRLLVLAPHEGIVSSELWLACRKKSPGKSVSGIANAKHSWLCGRIRCGKCGYAMIVRRYSGGNRFYCSMHLESSSCCEGVKPVDVSFTQDAIVPELLLQLDTLLRINIPDKSIDPKLAQYRKRIAALESEQEALLEKLPKTDEIVFAYIQNRLIEIDCLLKDALRACNHLTQSDTPQPQSNLTTASSIWERLSLAEKNRISHILIDGITVHDEQIQVMWRY